MKRRINISLHPIFILISSIYFLIFFTYAIKCLKHLIVHGFHSSEMIGIICSVLALMFFIYFVLVRYRQVEIYSDRYVLKSFVYARTIYFTEIDSVKQVPVNLFNLKLGSRGVLGFISFVQTQDYYNVSDLSNSLRIRLKNNDVLHISCDHPEELKNNMA